MFLDLHFRFDPWACNLKDCRNHHGLFGSEHDRSAPEVEIQWGRDKTATLGPMASRTRVTRVKIASINAILLILKHLYELFMATPLIHSLFSFSAKGSLCIIG